ERGHDNLLAAGVQVIENTEKDLLCFYLSGEKLDVVNQQHVNQLIEVHKIIDRTVLYGINVLLDKFFGLYIQHHFVRKIGLDRGADRLDQVRLPQARLPI